MGAHLEFRHRPSHRRRIHPRRLRGPRRTSRSVDADARYVHSEGGAPVVAKGADLIALKIRAIAEAHDIPIVEDKPLARSLYAAVEVERPIPAEFYRAVAEIVHLIQQRKAGWSHQRQ